MINSNAPGEDKIVLRKEFSWFLTEEFNNLRSLKEKHLPRYDTSQSHFANLIYYHVINRKLASYRHNSFNKTSIHVGWKILSMLLTRLEACDRR